MVIHGETYSDLIASLRWLTKTGVHFKWTEKCLTKLERLRDLTEDNTFSRRDHDKTSVLE